MGNVSDILCPECGSGQWVCWDELLHTYLDDAGHQYEMPVGYLRCVDCDHDWQDHDPATAGMRWLGENPSWY